MSDMLEQAIVDAQALREAAVKNAETLVLEKFSDQIKEAVEDLLEQEDPMAAEGGEEAAGAEEGAEDLEESPVMEHMPFAATQDFDEEVEIPLNKLFEQIEMLELAEAGKYDDGDGKDEKCDYVDCEDEGEKKDLDEALYEDLDEELYEELYEDLDEDLDVSELLVDEDETLEEIFAKPEDFDMDRPQQLKKIKGIPKRKPGETAQEFRKRLERQAAKAKPANEGLEEGADLDNMNEEDIHDLIERLVVDYKPVKSGWAGTPESVLQLAEEEILALEQDSEHREKMAAMRAAVAELTTVKESLETKNEDLTKSLKEAAGSIVQLRDAVYLLKEKLETSSLSNAKLIYKNKALVNASLNERQKDKLVEAISNAETIEEAKVIYETLQNAVGSTSRKKQPKSLSEAVQRPSSMILSNRDDSKRQKATPTFDRWKFLAGIDKK